MTIGGLPAWITNPARRLMVQELAVFNYFRLRGTTSRCTFTIGVPHERALVSRVVYVSLPGPR